MSALPSGWCSASLGELCSRIVDGSHNPPKAAESGHAMLSARNIQARRILFDDFRWISESDFNVEHARTQIAPGDVLLTIVGTIGRTAVVPTDAPKFALQRSVAVLKAQLKAEPRYLAYVLESPDVQRYFQENAKGTAQKGIYLGALGMVEVQLAPRLEQKRIADKLDALLARVDACRGRLDRVPGILKRFRQSVLAAATSGELTREWREERGLDGRWKSVRLADIGVLGRGKSRHRPRNDPRLYGGPFPFIQTGDIAQSNGRIEHHTQTYSEQGLAQSKLWPPSTLCITIAANIADTAILTYPACFPDSVVGFVADQAKAIPEFVKWSIDVIRDRLDSFAPATAQKNINLAILNEIEIRCPSVEEQVEIVRRVQTLFDSESILAGQVDKLANVVARLTPSMLAKAFRGELVPQDRNDEPASALLERVASGRALSKRSDMTQQTRRARTARAPKETDAMTKTRQDDDVMGQPYLANHLRRSGGSATAEALFKMAELPVADFYKQLAWEVTHGHVKDNQTSLETGHAAG